MAVVVIGLVSAAAFAASQSGDQEVTAQVAYAIELSVPSTFDWGELAIGDNDSPAQSVVVKSTGTYTLNVRGDRTTMGEYSTVGAFYVANGRTLHSPFQWRVAGQPDFTTIGLVDAPVVQDQPATDDQGATVSIQYRQHIGYGDHTLPDGNVYHITLTYTAVNGL